MGRRTVLRTVVAIDGARTRKRSDRLVVEEPLEIRIGGQQLAITMRTPGADFELTQGLLHAEGIISSRDDIRQMRYCAGTDEDGQQTYNVLDVDLFGDVAPKQVVVRRTLVMSSACGICGKESLDAVRTRAEYDLSTDQRRIPAAIISRIPQVLRDAQALFAETGGLHGAGLFSADGTALAVREDVGRHNAVDKVVGWALEHERLPARGTILMVSGRASFELVQKAVLAGIPILAAVSAPSSLAVDLADDMGLTLAGFVRGETMNVYTHAQRITG